MSTLWTALLLIKSFFLAHFPSFWASLLGGTILFLLFITAEIWSSEFTMTPFLYKKVLLRVFSQETSRETLSLSIRQWSVLRREFSRRFLARLPSSSSQAKGWLGWVFQSGFSSLRALYRNSLNFSKIQKSSKRRSSPRAPWKPSHWFWSL